MSIQSVTVTVEGNTYTLNYNSSSGKYEGTFTAPTTTSYNQTNHTYNCSVTALDNAGNSTTKDGNDFSLLYLRVKEKTKPTITTNYPSASAFVTNAKPTFTWSVTDEANGSGINQDTISITFDSNSAITAGITKTVSGNTVNCSYTPATALSEGSHTVKYDVSDNDGNAATQSSVAFTIDTIAPTLNVTSPEDNSVTNNSSCVVAGTVSDTASGLATLTINGVNTTVTGGAFNKTITLQQGSNTITVIATDNAGKSTTVVRTVTLNTVAPVISAVTLTPNPADVGATMIITVTVTEST